MVRPFFSLFLLAALPCVAAGTDNLAYGAPCKKGVQVYTNYEIGRQIVEEEQGGKRRAGYGEKLLIDLSARLTARFGRGWSVDNLQNMRSVYLIYSSVEIYETPSRKFLGLLGTHPN